MEKGSEKKRHSYSCLIHNNKKEQPALDHVRGVFREAIVAQRPGRPAVAPDPPRVAVPPAAENLRPMNQEEINRVFFAINEP